MSYPDLADLDEVNDEVNLLPYVSDANRYHQDEFWERIDREGGDCEDFALGKLNRLLARGWPISIRRLGCCFVEPSVPPPNNYHGVLQVDLPDGSARILDNRFNHPCTIEELDRIGYKPDRIQRVGGVRDWVQWLWVKT